VFFLLYFNRVIASIVSYLIRAYTWHRYRIYIDIQALQLSLLGGRLFFTGLRYHGNNETIIIQNGHITWSYWLHRVRDAQIYLPKQGSKIEDDTTSSSRGKRQKLPCRINVAVSGLEWFVYNRSAAYDSMLSAMTDAVGEHYVDKGKRRNGDYVCPSGDDKFAEGSAKSRQRLRKLATESDSQKGEKKTTGYSDGDEKDRVESRYPRASGSISSSLGAESLEKRDALPLILQLYPIHFHCDKGALVMGNDNTKALLIVKTKSLTGEIDAAPCQTVDPYRQLFEINFDHPVLEMSEHDGYKEDQLTRAVRDKQAALDSGNVYHRSFFRRQRRRVLGQLRNLIPYWRKSVESFSVDSRAGIAPAEPSIPGLGHWQGLSRYLNADDEDDKSKWSSLDYAAVNTVIDSPAATLRIHWDVPGKVLADEEGRPPPINPNDPTYVNGAIAPAWAISLALKGGVINYGPWADRQRAELQRVFFPGLCKDAVPANQLPIGSDRVPIVFNFYVELNDEVTLRIPTRESSKNWKWRNEDLTMKHQRQQDRRHSRGRGRGRDRKSAVTTANEQRPYGWLDIKIGTNATVSYNMDMLPSATGYHNALKIDLPSTEISTSVNHGLLWRSGAQHISCDLSTPLKWNGLRTWRFDVDSDEMELFLLREHTFLLIDLIDDWGTGPPSEYLLFTPFKYLLNLTLRNVKLYINVNDVNIINDPTSMDENTYLILSSPCLKVDTRINLDIFRPSKNAVPFKIEADTLHLGLHVPPWNTQATFLASKDIGNLERLVVDGKYHYNATTSPANTDTLVLDVTAQSLAFYLYGFLVRYFLQMKDNYFGDHVNFKTLDEYQQMLRVDVQGPNAKVASRPPPKKSNDLDVMLTIRADDPRIMLPANLYTTRRHIPIEAASLAVDLRFTNYYMDLDLCLTPLSLSFGDEEDEAVSPTSFVSKTQLFLDGLTVYGHRLFGLPPSEPTYLCNWDLNVGAITGECSAEFLATLIQGGKAFGFSLDDDENALIPYSSVVVYDVTFLRLYVESVHTWLHVEESAFLCSTGPIEVNYNDWARTHYSRRADVSIPRLEFSCIQSEAAARHNSRLKSHVETDIFFRTNLQFALVGRKYDFANSRKLQQELVRRHDQRTLRTDFLLVPDLLDNLQLDPVEPIAQSVPTVPQPALSSDINDRKSIASFNSSNGSQRLRHKSSFLSFASSSDADSILRGASELPKRSGSAGRSYNHLGPSRAVRSGSKRTVGENADSPNRHSLLGEPRGGTSRMDPVHTTVAFTSQFFPPYFPLEAVQIDPTGGLAQGAEFSKGNKLSASEFGLEDIDPEQFPQNCSHQSLLFDFPSGIHVVLNAVSLRCISALLQAFQPAEPENILDSLQIGAMSDIFGMQKKEKMSGTITDVILRLPCANTRFLNNLQVDASSPSQQHDQYDMSLEDLALAIRFNKGGSEPNGTLLPTTNLPSFHFRLASIHLTASERPAALGKTQAAAVVEVERVMALMGSKDVSYLDADIGAIRMRCSSGRIEYLASLIHRTNSLVSEMGKLFSGPSSMADERLKYFTHRVIMEGQRVSDPSFVVRPSAILRAATRHLRTYDSWKLVTRLRYMWATLSSDSQTSITRHCLSGSMRAPEDVREQVVTAFDRWRSWDLEDTGRAVLLDNIFGKRLANAPQSNSLPWMAVGRVHELQFGLDPTSSRNHVLILDVTTRLSNRHSLGGDDPCQLTAFQGPLTIVNLYCKRVGIHLGWELVELADQLLPLYWAASPQPPKDHQVSNLQSPVGHQPSRSLHFIFVMGQGAMSLDTVNLRVEPHCENLKLSVVNRNVEPSTPETNVALSCDVAAVDVLNYSQGLATIHLAKPSVIITYESLSVGNTPRHAIRAAASSQNIDSTILQDPIVLAEVIDLLIIDEATQLRELQRKLSEVSPAPTSKQLVTDSSPLIHLNLAMFLDSYKITVPLLHSLTYIITGTVARATMAAGANKRLTFEFDVKDNSHDMRVRSTKTPRSISLLQIPPINGRVTSQTTPGERSIEVFASLELVQLDASAVYSLLTALNRPEISNTISELQQHSKIIQDHIQNTFGSSTPIPPTSKSENPVLTYNIHASLTGVKISGNASIKSNSESSAVLLFFLDRIHLEVTNKTYRSVILENPEVHFNVRNVSFDIMKGSDGGLRSCGNLAFGALITASTRELEDGTELRAFGFTSDGFTVNLSPDTISTFVDVLGYMGDKFKGLDTSRELEYLRKLRQSKPRIAINDEIPEAESDIFDSFLASVMYSFEIRSIQIGWLVTTSLEHSLAGQEDLFLSVKMIEFATRKNNSARLTIEDLQLQMVAPHEDKVQRSSNSALLPEMIFNVAFVSTVDTRRLAFQAVGKSLDLRLTSGFIIPAAHLKDSIVLSVDNVQRASRHWAPIVVRENDGNKLVTEPVSSRRSPFGRKRLESVLIDADFAGAVVYLSAQKSEVEEPDATGSKNIRSALAGKYGQFSANETGNNTALRSPGLAWKVEYKDDGKEDANLYGEIKIEPSRNMIFPAVVPLIMDISSSIKEVVSDNSREPATAAQKSPSKPKANDEENLLIADPSTVLGRIKLNLGLRICKQEFTLSCQPIGRVAATARFDDIYVTINTVQSMDHGNFFAISGTFSKIHLAVQHVYSRESTGSFDVDSIVLSLMNSKHVSGTSGLSAIVKMSPMKVAINARQVHDFLLFREIWVPRELRQNPTAPVAEPTREVTAQAHLVQRYQQVAATAAFPWTATISISALDVSVDLGQSLGKPEFAIKNFWVSSKKTSDWEQNLCLGFEEIGINCDGRLSGFVTLQDFKLRTSIEWPEREQALNETPKVQASVGFSQFKLKAAFDYQAFFVADITSMEFLMYNVRQHKGRSGDRLVAIFDGEAVQVFGITTSAAQGAALWKAIQKFLQERKTNYETSLREIEKYMKRGSVVSQNITQAAPLNKADNDDKVTKSPISLHTDVVVTLRALNLGVFPGSFSDRQVFKLEALNARARFAASMEEQRIHSILGLTLGQLRIGLAGVQGPEVPRAVKDILVEHVVQNATGSRGGTILKVPKLEAVMETWQRPKSRMIQYKFKSAFEGKVEVGWNYSRITYIRGMWAKHSKMLAQVWGREIPAMSAIKVTGVPESDQERKEGEQQKITAEVNVPQSKYEYEALEPPIIETPQLRDMGEATPPLEWIGLHRERLPNLTHQIVIVALLELAGEVEDAYTKILGS
jgi:hypothetical protein